MIARARALRHNPDLTASKVEGLHLELKAAIEERSRHSASPSQNNSSELITKYSNAEIAGTEAALSCAGNRLRENGGVRDRKVEMYLSESWAMGG